MYRAIYTGRVTILHSVLLSSGRRRRSKTTTSKKEEKLLRQLRQITQLIQESRLEGASPEMEAEEVPYGADWEGASEMSNCSHFFAQFAFAQFVTAVKSSAF